MLAALFAEGWDSAQHAFSTWAHEKSIKADLSVYSEMSGANRGLRSRAVKLRKKPFLAPQPAPYPFTPEAAANGALPYPFTPKAGANGALPYPFTPKAGANGALPYPFTPKAGANGALAPQRSALEDSCGGRGHCSSSYLIRLQTYPILQQRFRVRGVQEDEQLAIGN
jgi:hypothetical protein